MKNRIIILMILLNLLSISCRASENSEWQIQELDDKAISNISVLSKTYGYIRYFYPNGHLKNFDWYKFLVVALNAVEEERNDEIFIQKMYDLFSPICPQVRLSTTKNEISEAQLSSNKYSFYLQIHEDEKVLESGNIKLMNSAEGSNLPIPDSLYCFPLRDNLYLYFPIAVTTLPVNSNSLKKLKKNTGNTDLKLFDKSVVSVLINQKAKKEISFIRNYKARVADIIIRRNIIQHFYPYYGEDTLNNTWDSICEEYYRKAALSGNMYNFYDNICELMHNVKDFHIDVYPSVIRGKVGTYFKTYYPGISMKLVTNDTFPRIYNIENDSIKHKVLKVNNFSSEDMIKRKLKNISYSTIKSGYYKLKMTGKYFNSFQKDSVICLTMEDSSTKKEFNQKIQTNKTSYEIDVPHDTIFIASVNDSVVYLNICSSIGSYKEFLKNKEQISKARVLLFDMRGYPRDYTMSILSHLIKEAVSLGNLKKPYIFFPDQKNEQYIDAEKWYIAPALSSESIKFSKKYDYIAPARFKLTARCYFYANESCISFAETLLEIIKHYKIGEIIGDYTAGCNGDAIYVDMSFAPFRMSVNKFLFRDESQHHCIGIEPDIFISNKNVPDVNSDLLNIMKYLYSEN